MQSCLTQASIPIEKGRLRAMLVHLLRTKLLRAEVTGARLDYEGSLALDRELMDLVGLLPYERILIGNLANGQRFETYAIPAPAGTREVCLNGATAHLGQPGHLLVIMSFAEVPVAEAPTWQPRTATLGDRNRRIVRLENPAASPALLSTFQR
jgi:aspartate 1-decarboxylase